MSTRSLLLLVALIGGAELCVRGHLGAQGLAFHAGAWLLAGALWIASRRLPATPRRAARVLAALPALLSLAELWPRGAATPPAPSASFEEAHGDPQALARWWQAHERERAILTGETELVPGQRFSWFDTEIELDERGLRRAPAPVDGAYRIVVLGGSASFGTDRTPAEHPWPELLAAELAARYACARPIAVTNAARPARTLQELGSRFDDEVAPLEPDLLLVYPDLDALAGLGPSQEELPQTRRPQRVSRLLAAAEARLRERSDARRLHEALAAPLPPEALRQSLAARRYRGLLVAARTRGIDVALVPLALALDGRSPEAVIRFHEAVWANARQLVVANQNHARLLPLLAAAYRAQALPLGDDVDGAWQDGFLDLVHFTQAGSERLARGTAVALEPLLSRQDPGCKRR